ncbi:MAG: molybdate ABC transporter substrate-binding protein [Actinomycetota bacterium]
MKRRIAASLAIALAGLGGCGGRGAQSHEVLLVFAAASLTESFTDIGRAFERRQENVVVQFSWGPSDGLANGIQGGGPADVFASASPTWMDAVAATPGVLERDVFARNRLTIIVPKDNPAGIASIADLAKPGVKLVLAAPDVPAGNYARDALKKAGLEAAERNVVSNEEDVKGVVQKVLLGEADAGIVYATDVTEAVVFKISAVGIPEPVNVIASYPIAVVRGTKHERSAREFVAFVLGDGQDILRAAGFLAP